MHMKNLLTQKSLIFKRMLNYNKKNILTTSNLAAESRGIKQINLQDF